MARALEKVAFLGAVASLFFASLAGAHAPRFWERAKATSRAEADAAPSLRRILEGRAKADDALVLGETLRKIRARENVVPETAILAILAGTELGYVRVDAEKEAEAFLRLAEAGLTARESGAKAHAFFLRGKMLAENGASPERDLREARKFAVDVEQAESIGLSLALEAVFETDEWSEPEVARLAEESRSRKHRILAELVLFMDLAKRGDKDALRFLRSAQSESAARQNVAGTSPWGDFAIRKPLRASLERLLAMSLDEASSDEACEGVLSDSEIGKKPTVARVLGCEGGLGGKPAQRSPAAHHPAETRAKSEKQERRH